ncbi:hypothetical protein [Nocardioides endophyticus]
MKTVLTCPCGVVIRAEDDDVLVEAVHEHLNEAHPGRTYTRDEILFMAL